MKRQLFFLCLSFLISQQNFAQTNGSGSIISGARTRTFAYHLPTTGTQACNLPVLLAFHGDGGNGAGFQSYAGFDALANTQNFIVVYPDAALTGGSLQFNKYADAAPGFGTTGDPGFGGTGDPNAPDDVLFTSDLIAYLSTTYQINRNRVYATGHSGGAFMCYFLAVALANKIAAIAPLAGSLWINSAYSTNRFATANYIPIPVLHIHSKGDPVVTPPIVPYPQAQNYVWPLSQFAGGTCANYSTYTTTAINANADLLTFCNTGKKVQLIVTKDATHGWSTAVVPQNEIWNFVKNFSLTTFPTTACSSQTGQWQSTTTWESGILPNITNDVLIKSMNVITLPLNQTIQVKSLNLKGELKTVSGSVFKVGN
jgi:endoglucanase